MADQKHLVLWLGSPACLGIKRLDALCCRLWLKMLQRSGALSASNPAKEDREQALSSLPISTILPLIAS